MNRSNPYYNKQQGAFIQLLIDLILWMLAVLTLQVEL